MKRAAHQHFGRYESWEKLNRGVSKPGCFPLFSGKVQIVSRTPSGLFLVGAPHRPRKRKRTTWENPRTIPEQIGKIPGKGQKRTKKDKQVQIGKPPRLKHPRLAALEKGSSVSWVAKFKEIKIQNANCQWVVAKLQGDEDASFCRKWVVTKLQGDKSASQFPWNFVTRFLTILCGEFWMKVRINIFRSGGGSEIPERWEGKSALSLSNLGKFCHVWAPGYLFMLDLSAASKFIYVRPVGGPENTSNMGDNPSINNLVWPPRLSP